MLEEWCHNAYLNGLKELYQSRNRKWHLLFWVVVMVVMVGSSVYFVVKIIMEYVSSPTVTRVATFPMSAMEMPEVMICFNGGLNAGRLSDENFSTDLIYVLSGALPLGTLQFENLTRTKDELDSYLRINSLTVSELYEKFAYQCEDMVDVFYAASTDRSFGNQACKLSQPYISPVYGRCTVHRNTSRQLWPGLSGGVRTVLNFPPNSVAQRFPSPALLCDRTMSYAISLEKNFKMQTERFVLIAPGVKAEIVLNPKRYVRLPGGQVDCNPDSDNGNLCSGRCYADAVFLSCGCVPFKYFETEYHKGKTICTPFDEDSCTTFESYSIPCQQGCTPACEEWVYETTMSYGLVMADGNDSVSPKSSVWIGFETLQYMEIREIYAYSAVDAIAGVGGQLGLWLGVSIVSIVQAIYYLYMACSRLKQTPEVKEKIIVVRSKTGENADKDFMKKLSNVKSGF